MEQEHYQDLMAFSYKVAKALEKSVSCERIGMSVIGLEVPHVHVHLIPINEMRDMTFAYKVDMTSDQMQELAAAVAANMD